MTIHRDHPFLEPPEERDQVRRLRGRLGGQVSLWTGGEGGARAGLTVSSLMVAGGEPGRVLGLIDPDSDLLDSLCATGAAVVALLRHEHLALAEIFAGEAPAPGGQFAQSTWSQTPWGPVPDGATTWAGVRLESVVEVGWSSLVTAVVDHLVIGEDGVPLSHRRGRYQNNRDLS